MSSAGMKGPGRPDVSDFGPRRDRSGFLEGNLYILLATILFGLNFPVVKLLIPKWMTAMDVTVFRVVGACVLMWIVSMFFKTTAIERGDRLRIALGGVLGLFPFMCLFNMALHYGDPIDISIIMTLPPVFVIVIGMLFQHRAVSWLEVVGVLVAFCGAFLIISTGHTGDAEGRHRLLGDLLALASSLCYALYLVIMERPTHRYAPMSLLRWAFLAASVPALFLVPAMPHAPIFHGGSVEAWSLVAFTVLGPTFLAYFLINPAMKMIGSELVSLYQYFLPVVATVASIAVGLTSLHWMQVLAMVIIVGGMVMTTMANRRRTAGRVG